MRAVRQVNMSCTILHFVSDPNWRPTFRFHHWSISLIAAALCAGPSRFRMLATQNAGGAAQTALRCG